MLENFRANIKAIHLQIIITLYEGMTIYFFYDDVLMSVIQKSFERRSSSDQIIEILGVTLAIFFICMSLVFTVNVWSRKNLKKWLVLLSVTYVINLIVFGGFIYIMNQTYRSVSFTEWVTLANYTFHIVLELLILLCVYMLANNQEPVGDTDRLLDSLSIIQILLFIFILFCQSYFFFKQNQKIRINKKKLK